MVKIVPVSTSCVESCKPMTIGPSTFSSRIWKMLMMTATSRKNLIDLRNNCWIQMEFNDGHLDQFIASQLETYSVLAKKSLYWCLYVTTYLCKTGFSCQLHIKTKSRNWPGPQHDMQGANTTKGWRFDVVINRKQQQKCHWVGCFVYWHLWVI